MALKIFLLGIGIFFASSLAMLMLVKQFVAGFANAGKMPIVYGLISSLLAAIIAYGLTYATDNLFALYWMLAALFLAFGIVHMIIMHSKFYARKEEEKGKVMFGELLFACSVVLFSIVAFAALEYFTKDRLFLFYPLLLSALFFFIPLLFVKTFDTALSIPGAAFSIWQYPVGHPIDPPEEKENERLLVIGFEIAKKATDANKTYFRARGPEEIKLGELFYHFINDYNDLHSETPIQFLESEDEPYEWWFRRKAKWYQGQRVFDPFLTIMGNGIKENSVIICERIPANFGRTNDYER